MIADRMASILYVVLILWPFLPSAFALTDSSKLLTKSISWIGWFQMGPPIIRAPSHTVQRVGTLKWGSLYLSLLFVVVVALFSSSSYFYSAKLDFLIFRLATVFPWSSTSVSSIVWTPRGCSQKLSHSQHWKTWEYLVIDSWHCLGPSLTLMNSLI
jgi:hypothetical protein